MDRPLGSVAFTRDEIELVLVLVDDARLRATPEGLPTLCAAEAKLLKAAGYE